MSHPVAPSSSSLVELFGFALVPTDGKYSWLFGVFLAAMASIVSNLGLTLQKLTHQRIASGYDRSNRPYYNHALWIVGLCLVTFASIADVIALCFAPQSLIAPLGALTMVSNVIFAPLLLHERIGMRDMLATFIILSGSVVAVIFGAHEDVIYPIKDLFQLFTAKSFIAYFVCVCIGVCILLYYLHMLSEEEDAHKNGQGPELSVLHKHWQRFAYPAIAGTIGAQSVLFAKCSVELIMNTARHDGNAFIYYQTYLILISMFITIFLQIKWLNDGLFRFDTSYIVPVFVSFWIILSVMSGMIFFKEYQSMSWTQIGLFFLGVGCTVAGVILLSFRPMVHNNSRGTSAFDDVFDQNDEYARGGSPYPPRSRRGSADGAATGITESLSAASSSSPPILSADSGLARRSVGGSNGNKANGHGAASPASGSIAVSVDASENIDSSLEDPASVLRREAEADAADRSDEENERENLLDGRREGRFN